MKVKQALLALITLFMATAFFSCSMEMPEAESLSDSAVSRSSALACPDQQNYCFTVDYSKESTGDGAIKSCSTKSGTYVQGTEIVVAAAPCEVSKSCFTGWYDAPGGGKLVSKEATYRFKLNCNTALYARFDKECQTNYSLTIDYWAKSSADGDVRKSTPTGTYQAGTEITVVAEPCLEQSAYFAGWYDAKYEGNLVSKEATYRFKLTGNTALYARFDKGCKLLIEYEAQNTGYGEIGWNGIQDYIYFNPKGRAFPRGTEMTLGAFAYRGCSFVGWYDAKEGGNLISTKPVYSLTLTEDTALYARYHSPAVNFPDPALDRAVRKAVGKPTGQLTYVNVYRIYGITSFPRENNNLTPISDLSGIENITELKELSLSNNQISDIKALTNLIYLNDLYLDNNQITDITALTKLTDLLHLHLNDNQITDISPLANITDLRVLYLNNNKITDIGPLANDQIISLLDLSNNEITDISPLTNIEIVDSLNLSNNKISDISALAKTKLPYTAIDLSNNQITDITPLIENPTLQRYNTVYLKNNNIPAEQIEALKAKGVRVVH